MKVSVDSMHDEITIETGRNDLQVPIVIRGVHTISGEWTDFFIELPKNAEIRRGSRKLKNEGVLYSIRIYKHEPIRMIHPHTRTRKAKKHSKAWWAPIDKVLAPHKFIEGVKLYRNLTNKSLRDSKLAIDKRKKKLGIA